MLLPRGGGNNREQRLLNDSTDETSRMIVVTDGIRLLLDSLAANAAQTTGTESAQAKRCRIV
jgi:hypothetical protein